MSAPSRPADVEPSEPEHTFITPGAIRVALQKRAEPVEAAAAVPAGRANRLHVLDLLRFLAALAVLGYHVFANDGGAWVTDTKVLFGPIGSAFEYGWLGVECFFVISGFVICMSSWGRSLSAFFVSRATRLMPMYVFAVVVTSLALTMWPPHDGAPPLTNLLVNLTMLQSFVGVPNIDNVYWTLFIELKFYLLFSIVVSLGVTLRRVLMFCGLWLIAALYAHSSGFPLLVSIVEPRFAPFFIAGITLYLIHRFGWNLVLGGLLAVCAALCVFSLNGRVAEFNPHLVSFKVAVAVLVCFFAAMTAVALGWLSWLHWRGLAVLGALTYPVYLLHYQLSHIAIRLWRGSAPHWLLAGTVIAIVLAFAYAAHRLVERPVARLMRDRLTTSIIRLRRGNEAGDR